MKEKIKVITVFKSNKYELLLFVIIIVLCCAPKFVASSHQAIYPFSLSSYSVTESIETGYSFGDGSVQYQARDISSRFLNTALIISLSEATGLDGKAIAFLPLLAIPFALAAFVLGTLITKRTLGGYFASMCISYNPGVLLLTNNLFYISVGLLFYLAFFIVLILFLQRILLFREFIVLSSVFFIGTFISYYSAEFYILTALLIASLILTISTYSKRFRSNVIFSSRAAIIMVLAGITALLFFLMQENAIRFYLRQVNIDEFLDEFGQGFVISLKGTSKSALSQYAYTAPRVFSFFEVLFLMVLLIPVIIYGIYLIIRFLKLIRKNEISIKAFHIAIIVVVLTIIANMFIYLPLGLLDTKYIILMLPPFSFLLLIRYYNRIIIKNKFTSIFPNIIKKYPSKTIALILFILLIIRFLSAVSLYESIYGENYYDSIHEGSTWIVDEIKEGQIITDLRTGEYLLLEMASRTIHTTSPRIDLFNETTVFVLYNITDFSLLENLSARAPVYVVITKSMETSPIRGSFWSKFKPAKGLFQRYDTSPYFSQVYYDGFTGVYELEI
jgi:hypothetical protein